MFVGANVFITIAFLLRLLPFRPSCDVWTFLCTCMISGGGNSLSQDGIRYQNRVPAAAVSCHPKLRSWCIRIVVFLVLCAVPFLNDGKLKRSAESRVSYQNTCQDNEIGDRTKRTMEGKKDQVKNGGCICIQRLLKIKIRIQDSVLFLEKERLAFAWI